MAKSASQKPKITPDQFKLQMGKCLFAWQGLEEHLFGLFWIATQIPNYQVCSAVFSTIINISVKGDLTDAAIKSILSSRVIEGGLSEGTIGVSSSNNFTDLLAKWAELYAKIGSNSTMRNKVVHNHLINFASPKADFNDLALVPHIYKVIHDFDYNKLQKQIITYDRLKEIEKESQEITIEILRFMKELEEALAKESS